MTHHFLRLGHRHTTETEVSKIHVLVLFLFLTRCINSGSNDLLLGTVDSFGHLIVSKLDTTGKGKLSLLCCIVMIPMIYSQVPS